MRRIALLAFLAVCSCATPQTAPPTVERAAIEREAVVQQTEAIRKILTGASRVADVHWRLASANAALCPRTIRDIGMPTHSLSDYRNFREAAKAAGARDAPSVPFVVAGSPAAEAGVRVGDRVMSLNSLEWPTSQKGRGTIAAVIDRLPESVPLDLVVRRDGKDTTLRIKPTRICAYPISYSSADVLNASANGDSILMFARMVDFTNNDDELALIIGHELAHNTQGHIDAQKRNALLGQIAGSLVGALVSSATGADGGEYVAQGKQAGAQAFSRAFESEADYVGMYYIARAGFRLDNVEDVWRRMGALSLSKLDFTQTHPPDAKRYLEIAAARDEIRAKQSAGAALTPNLKRGR